MTCDKQHPMIPPNILLNNWESDWFAERQNVDYLLTEAYQAGADAELEACCEWLKSEGHEYEHEALFATRRPKPPSLKKQALEALDDFSKMSETLYSSYDPPEEIYSDQVDIIRRALEALPDDL